METQSILVLDDEIGGGESIESLLVREGYKVTKACCGRDALSIAVEIPFDLVFLDISIPEMDGFEVMKQLLQIDSDLLIIMVAGCATVESAVKALKHGAYDYLKKPFEYADLIKTVKNALNQRRLMQANKSVTERLKASKYRCRDMINNSPDLVYLLDSKGCFLFINNEFERVLGRNFQSVLGKPFSSIVHSEDLKKCRPGVIPGTIPAEDGGALQLRFKKCELEPGSEPGSQLGAQSGLGQNDFSQDFIWVELKATVMELPENENQAYCIARDVTERKNLQQQLHQAQKMEAIGTLAGGIAHDFNNILMGIQGYTSLVRMTLDPQSPEYKKLAYVEDYVNSGSDMTRQLLGFVQKNDHELNLVNINYILKTSAKMFGRTKKDIIIRQNLEKKLWSCEVDENLIKQVLLNLFVNAWQAMAGGGEIHVKSENLIISESKSKELGLEKPGSYVCISVVDTGTGMDAKTLERIFEPFFTTKGRLGGGTGLGLATAYGIIKSHCGSFQVLSKEGEGSSFSFYLPGKEVRSSRRSVGRRGAEVITGKGSVLLVDDEEGILEVCSEMIKSLGYSVKAVTSGMAAIDVVKEDPGNIDLVILDMIMPGMSGLETFEQIKLIHPKAKVLISSGYNRVEELAEFADFSVEDFIPKPYDMALLSAKIKRAVGGAVVSSQ